LTFQDGTDDYFARQQVMERLATVGLPDGVQPELAPLSTAVGEIFRYVVEAPATYSPTQLRDLQDWVIKPYLLQTKGVADVVTFGGPLKQFHILTNLITFVSTNSVFLILRRRFQKIIKIQEVTFSNVEDKGLRCVDWVRLRPKKILKISY
jgi:Cu/Ag efflux pump CusA